MFYFPRFLEIFYAPWLHYGYCHHCLNDARLKDEEKVLQHAKSCEALKILYPPDDLLMTFKFYGETENAIIHGIDKLKAYQFLREQPRGYFMLDQALPAHRAEMWKLRKIQKLKTILLQRTKQLQLLKGKPQQMRRVFLQKNKKTFLNLTGTSTSRHNWQGRKEEKHLYCIII